MAPYFEETNRAERDDEERRERERLRHGDDDRLLRAHRGGALDGVVDRSLHERRPLRSRKLTEAERAREAITQAVESVERDGAGAWCEAAAVGDASDEERRERRDAEADVGDLFAMDDAGLAQDQQDDGSSEGGAEGDRPRLNRPSNANPYLRPPREALDTRELTRRRPSVLNHPRRPFTTSFVIL